MPTEDRRNGKLLPDPVVPPDTVCFTIQIPNAVQYRAAFLGQINVLGMALTWDHPTDGTECLDCELAAQLWRNAIYNSIWSDECGGEMSCDDVTDCIENDEQTRAAVRALAGQQATPGMQSTPGERLPDSVWGANLADTDTCNYDSFWSQCKTFTDYIVNLGNDLLEQIEVYTNALEAGEKVKDVPVLGSAVDKLPASKYIELLDWVIESVSEWYAGADTEEARIEIACALFCKNRDECNLSLSDTWNVLNERSGGVFSPSSIESLDDLVEAAITLLTSPTVPLDAWILFVISLARVMGYLGVNGIEKTLNIMLMVAADQGNDDWETLCDGCPPPVEGVWEIITTYPGTGGNGGTIQSETANSVTMKSQLFNGEHRIIASIKEFGPAVTLTSAPMTGTPIATYNGNGPALFQGTWGNTPIAAGSTINWIYIASSVEITLTMNW